MHLIIPPAQKTHQKVFLFSGYDNFVCEIDVEGFIRTFRGTSMF